jgi:predicted  nucleic acid-binding Zn-ribbon protein
MQLNKSQIIESIASIAVSLIAFLRGYRLTKLASDHEHISTKLIDIENEVKGLNYKLSSIEYNLNENTDTIKRLSRTIDGMDWDKDKRNLYRE